MSGVVGYDPDWFVDRDSHYVQSLLCSVCLLVVRDAAESHNSSTGLDACGHVFCADCIEKSLSNKSECPTCRRPLNKSQVKPAMLIRRLVMESKIKCTLGCGWTGELGKAGYGLDGHLNKDCPKSSVCCPFNASHDMMPRASQQKHMLICRDRSMPCLMACGLVIPLQRWSNTLTRSAQRPSFAAQTTTTILFLIVIRTSESR